MAIESLEVYSKMKLAKLTEIEAHLEAYKAERLESIQNDIARQSKANYKKIDELAALNDDYNKRMVKLQELTLSVEADMRLIEFKNKQISMLQARNQEIEMLLANSEVAVSETTVSEAVISKAVDSEDVDSEAEKSDIVDTETE